MIPLRPLALLTSLCAIAYSAGTEKVVNNCPHDVTVTLFPNDSDGHVVHFPLKAGGGTTDAMEHTDSPQGTGFDIIGVHDGQISTRTRIDTSFNKVWYDLALAGENPIDGHFTLSTSDSACGSITSDIDLTQTNEDTEKLCNIAASMVLTLCD